MTTSKSKKKPVRKAKPARQVHHAAPVKASKASKTPRAKMKRQIVPEDPQQASRIVMMPVLSQGMRVDEDKALTYSVVWACVKVIAETLGSLSWHVLEQKENGDKERRGTVAG